MINFLFNLFFRSMFPREIREHTRICITYRCDCEWWEIAIHNENPRLAAPYGAWAIAREENIVKAIRFALDKYSPKVEMLEELEDA